MENTLSLNDYQKKALVTRAVGYRPEESVMGLLEESGEVAGVFKRLIRGDYDESTTATKLHKELGDVLWYLSAIAYDNNWSLEDIAQANLDKLSSRQLRGKLLGEGDDR